MVDFYVLFRLGIEFRLELFKILLVFNRLLLFVLRLMPVRMRRMGVAVSMGVRMAVFFYFLRNILNVFIILILNRF